MGTIAQVFEQSRRDSLTIISDLKYGFYHARNTCQHFLSEHFLDKNNCSKGYFARYTSSEKRTLTFFINRVSFV
ncbi:MAG TPA: hypothetical protein DDX98_10770 [Bacteroidales bacterium]|nr:hypothetical protein [Bacteroidales bacterium]